MAIVSISNGEVGSSVRTKLNLVIDAVNSYTNFLTGTVPLTGNWNVGNNSVLFPTGYGIDSSTLGSTLYIGVSNASNVQIGNGGSIAFNGSVFLNNKLSAANISATGLGVNTNTATLEAAGQFVTESTTAVRGVLSDQYSTDTLGSLFVARKSRGSFTTKSTIVTGDALGGLSVYGYTNAYTSVGLILVESTGTVSSGIIPTKMTFSTTNSIGTLTGAMVIDAAQNINIGNAVSTNQRLVRIGQDTAFMDFGSKIGATANFALYCNQATPTASNYSLEASASTTSFNGPAELNLKAGGVTYLAILKQSGQPTFNFTGFAQTSGVDSVYKFTMPATTGSTASTENIGFSWVSGSLGHATGAIAIQRDYVITGRTHTFVGASVISDAYTLHVSAPIASTNATFTRSFALGLTGNLALDTAGNGIYIKEGSNATMGTGTLVAGVATISNTKVTASSRIFAFRNTASGTLGDLSEDSSVRVAGTSFAIKSMTLGVAGTVSTLDTSSFTWILIEPA